MVNTGTWYAETKDFKATTWNAYRSGGSPASIKLERQIDGGGDTNIPLWIAPPSYRGIQWTPSSTGTHKVKVYVVFKKMADPTDLNDKFVVQIEVPRSTGRRDIVYSSIEGTWSEDSVSVWMQEENLYQRMLELPFNVTVLEPVNVRMQFKWYDNNGYMYLDPSVVFE